MRKLILIASATAALMLTATTAQAQANPDAARTNAARSGPCRDPWVKIALDEVYGVRSWGPVLCATKLYNNASWGSYADLLRYVREVRVANDTANLKLMIANGQGVVVANGVLSALLPSFLIGNDVAGLVGNDGASILSNANGALISNVPGGLISNVPASVVTGLPPANFGAPSTYTLQDASKTKVRYGPNLLSFPKK